MLARKRRSRFRLPCWIADHRRKIANQKNCGVAHVLKLLELSENYGVAQMNIRSRRIDAQIHAQRLLLFRGLLEFRFQLVLANNFRHAFP